MSSFIVRHTRSGPLFGQGGLDVPSRATPRDHACGGDHVIDFALCLIIAAAIVGLLLLAL